VFVQQVFIELYNYKTAWSRCPEEERTVFAKKVSDSVESLKAAGVEVVAYGMNSVATDRRAPYDFFCVYRVPNAEFQREFERRIAASGWYDYFDQVNISGDARGVEETLLANVRMDRPTSVAC
jgi:haloalkane dehalogenase